jgi:quercetin dioxygenase-like cupin family protein
MDDGDPVTLGPGDAVVQNGTRHRWTNVGDGPVVLASVVLGAHDAGTAAAGAAR